MKVIILTLLVSVVFGTLSSYTMVWVFGAGADYFGRISLIGELFGFAFISMTYGGSVIVTILIAVLIL